MLSAATRNVRFRDLGLSPGVLRGVAALGFDRPSPVQLRGIPPARFGADLVIQSKAGTGKTLVFAVAILENLDLSAPPAGAQGLQAVVLAPTREIAHQICGVIRAVGKEFSGGGSASGGEGKIEDAKSSSGGGSGSAATATLARFTCHCFIGGLPLKRDVQTIRAHGCHVAVGTPGRVRQLVERGDLDPGCAGILVIDEADKMLGAGSQNGFGPDIAAIAARFPERRQVMAFSATFPQRLANRIAKMMNNAVIIQECQDEAATGAAGEAALGGAASSSNNALAARGPSLLGVAQYHVKVGRQGAPDSATTNNASGKTATSVSSSSTYTTFTAKTEVLHEILSLNHFNQCIVFCNHRGHALSLSRKLQHSGWPTGFLAGDLPQRERLRVFAALQRIQIRVLVSTDLSARGIDCNTVDLVVNLDLPGDAETYLHRVGRTGRFGSVGAAVTIVDAEEEGAIQRLEELYGAEIGELDREDLRMPRNHGAASGGSGGRGGAGLDEKEVEDEEVVDDGVESIGGGVAFAIEGPHPEATEEEVTPENVVAAAVAATATAGWAAAGGVYAAEERLYESWLAQHAV